MVKDAARVIRQSACQTENMRSGKEIHALRKQVSQIQDI